MRSAAGGEPRERGAGLIVARRARLRHVLRVAVEGYRVAAYEVVADPVRLRGLEPAVLDVPTAA
ncbi:hypothetical protein ABT404_41790 [Streptomyces hyaluromycini]|uniref:Uncharacterized protein n=1 Tax=Streptomyces hyaluromycini TaxID=1377993 RepID=A0ABV1XA55_9ACTN